VPPLAGDPATGTQRDARGRGRARNPVRERGRPDVRVRGAERGPVALRRRRTTIEGLDEVMGGGLPVPSTVLVAGEPGAGKTTLCVQFLFGGVRLNENGLYITAISEPQWLRPPL